MSRFKAAKKLDAFDTRIDALEAERHALEAQALGGEPTDGSRRERYFGIADADARRKLIGIERELHDQRRGQGAAAVDYWSAVATETREKLDDLRNDGPGSKWRRGLWLDILTILWILVGGGWWAFDIAGGISGAIFTAVWAPFLVRGRERARVGNLRKGEEILRSAENELRLAEREAARQPAEPVFSATEATAGIPDAG